MDNVSSLTAGIDTSKAKLDVAIHASPIRLTVENNAVGYKHLAAELQRAGVVRVGIEASSGYARGVIKHFRIQRLEVIIMQPMQVKAFARLHLRRAKNDALDAELIAACAAILHPHDTQEDKRIQPLADALTFVEQIEGDIMRIKTRLEKVIEPRLALMMNGDIKRLVARRRSELRRILAALRQHEDLARKPDPIETIDGVGERTAVAIVVGMAEIGAISREQATALAG